MSEFSSPLASRIQEFVDTKRYLGYKYEAEIYKLRWLDEICAKYSDGSEQLTKEMVDEWTARRPNTGTLSRERLVKLSIEFGKFLSVRGIESYIIPVSQNKFNRPRAYVPYIFTHEQVKIFLMAADAQPAHRLHPFCNRMYSVLFRILYCCGLRISEALNLTYNRIDQKEGVLLIRDSKFGKDRLIPMSDSLTQLCREYLPLIRAHNPDNAHIFASRFNDGPVLHGSAYKYFRKILWESGIPHGGSGKGPRLHDFRHTFAVHSLRQWAESGVDVYAALPALADYLGHGDLGITEKYLRLTAEVYPELIKLSEAYSGTAIPEVKFFEND